MKNTDTVERYDYYDDEWIEVAPMEIPRNGIAAAAWDGHIYVTGTLHRTAVLSDKFALF